MPQTRISSPLPARELAVDGLACERDERVLFSGLSLSLKPGELLLVEGQNGAGKTSLLRILCGLAEPVEGEVSWNGRAIHSQREDYAAELFYLGHLPGVKLDLSPEENLGFVRSLRNRPSREQILAALKAVGLYGYEDQPARTLSAGQRRRVALAGLCLSDAPLWILDEPFTALDKAGVAWLQDCLSSHLERGGLIVMTTHQALELGRQVRSLAL
ncbi:MAG: cytochrome c biogenesis heme-transporting ATPase CcmA [Gammaproteobacteria bacterium]|nr:cytochrome c biogenesis heme-transporting ATPase CcmA [Gammaproteobacteria bacterium]